MKKMAFVLVMLCVAMNLFAGDARVATLGGHTGLIPDDDSNIGLFPQRVNDWNILRLQDMGGDYSDYLLTTGEKGNKWAFYGSVWNENYLFNVIKSLSPTSAIDLGVQLMTLNGKLSHSSDKSEYKISEMTLEVDLAYGMDMGQSEVVIGGYFANGPRASTVLYDPVFGNISADYGTIERSSDGEKLSEDNAGYTAFGAGIAVRTPFNFFIFDQLYHNLNVNISNATEESIHSDTKVQDDKYTEFYGSYQAYFFKNKSIIPQDGLIKSGLLMYGLGFNVGYGTIKAEDKLPNADYKHTTNGMWIGGPSLRIGLETAVKFAKVRFGIQRDISIFQTAKEKYEIGEAEDELSGSMIGSSGSLFINSGLGFEFKNLKIDIMLNKSVWRNGPQMIFNDTYGDLSFQTDVTYTFPSKEK